MFGVRGFQQTHFGTTDDLHGELVGRFFYHFDSGDSELARQNRAPRLPFPVTTTLLRLARGDWLVWH